MVELDALMFRLSRSTIKVELCITPLFEFFEESGSSELFLIFVEDVYGEQLLHSDTFVLQSILAKEPHSISFILHFFEPLSPNYFINVISDR